MKKIIGYILTNQKYIKAASEIIYGFSSLDTIITKDISIRYLKEAGVLDLWFEPVYEEGFKVGDWVVVLPEDNYYKKANQDKAQEIIKIDEGNPSKYFLTFFNDDQNIYTKIRKATAKETKEIRNAPLIGCQRPGYKRGYVRFGCRVIPNYFITLLYNLQLRYNIDFEKYKKEIAIIAKNLKE